MTSGKQRRDQIRSKRVVRKGRAAGTIAPRARPEGAALCNPDALAPSNSYGTPEFASRGYYLDTEFHCVDCGTAQVWTSTQQKWWYEVAKGYVYSFAKRCRLCRRARRQPPGKKPRPLA